MSITGAQIQSVVKSQGGSVSGMVAGADVIAAGADDFLRRCGAKTVTECALLLATVAQESGGFRYTQELGSGQSYAPYVGRTFIQLTWQSNYRAFGDWCKSRGLVTDAGVFVKNPSSLAEVRWAWLGATYFCTASRSWGNYSSVVDVARKTGSILAVSRAVNAGNPNSSTTPNGMSSRTAWFNAFKALGSSIIPSSSSAVKVTTTQQSKAAPKGAVPGTPAQVLAAGNALWNKYKGKLYTYAWPGWKELGYGISSGYWCAAFVSLAFKKGTGFDWKVGLPTSSPAYCPALVSAMVRSSYWDEKRYGEAQPGDVVFFFNGPVAYHVGIVEFGPTSGGHDMRTIEGNTSTPGLSASMSRGGTLAKKTRDDRLYRMRIFRPTYWQTQNTADDAAGAAAPDAVDVVDVDTATDAPDLTTFNVVDAPELAVNPIDALNVSESFLASIGETATRWCRVSAGIGGRIVAENLPIVAEQSKVTVDATRPVRREATFVVQPDPYDETHAGLRELLSHPSLELYAEVGFSWGDYHEGVPVFDGIRMSSKWDWETGQITLTAQDRMYLTTTMGFGSPVCSNPECSYVDAIRFFITEADPRAKVIDLTKNTDKIPSVVWMDGPSMRIDTVSELAMAIGAEVFKSPARDYYVIRPISTLGVSSKWTTRQGEALVSLSETADDSKVRNRIIAKSERADQQVIFGEWVVTDPDSPFHPATFGNRIGFWSTALLTERDQLETAAQSIVSRLIGARTSIDYTQLVNPLMEGGDPSTVVTDTATWSVIIDGFEIPLGSQPATAAQARTLTTEGVS